MTLAAIVAAAEFTLIAAQNPLQQDTARQSPPSTTPVNSAAGDLRQTSDVFALLNRIEDIVNQALKDTPATASAKAGTTSSSRSKSVCERDESLAQTTVLSEGAQFRGH